MYSLVLILHSFVRWEVVVLTLVAFARGVRGWSSGASWSETDRKVSLFLTISVDLQLLLGLALYFGLSPYTRLMLSDPAAVMKDATLRFFSVEHVSVMLLAVAFAHIGKVRAARAATDTARHRSAALWFGLALLAILLATPWPFSSQSRPLLRLAGAS